MNGCNHDNLEYLGIQETDDPNKSLFLFNCINCGTTIAIPEKNILEVLLKMVKEKS